MFAARAGAAKVIGVDCSAIIDRAKNIRARGSPVNNLIMQKLLLRVERGLFSRLHSIFT